ncbi:MAG: FctA domain-containing protein [Eubacteriales bacterium]|nr:FctA domain-containing protein [Eubacteriales bacterium]MDD4541260.1 FctA domain-containing protein [Eubacteriales bacterium]
MKKILVLLLALLMALAIPTAAFAIVTTAPVYEDMTTVNLNKQFVLTNADTTNLAETFNFKIKPYSVSDAGAGITTANMPMFTPFTGTGVDREYTTSISFALGEATVPGDTNSTTLTLPTYTSVGIYKYIITETAGTTAGVSYDSNPMYLTVTVVEQNGKVRIAALHYGTLTGSKVEYFENEHSAGSIEISKTVSGTLGDTAKYFDVVVTLTGVQGKTYAASYAVTGGSHATNPTTIAIGTPTTFKLKDGETITIANLPYGVTYTVVEADYTGEGYDAAAYNFSDNDKKIDSVKDTVGILNNKGGVPDTGISLDSLPYILLIALAGGGLIFYFARKRKVEE